MVFRLLEFVRFIILTLSRRTMGTLGGAPVALAKFDASSTATANAEYDLFRVNPTNTTELGSTIVTVEPTSLSNNSTEIECSLGPSAEHFTDLAESTVIVKLRFLTKDGSDLATATSGDLKVWPDNNLAHSIFSRLGLKINDTEVFYTSNYAHLAYIDTLMHETLDAKKGRLTASGWFEDCIAGKDHSEYTGEGTEGTAATLERKKLISESRVISLAMRPFTPLRDSSKRLPNNVSLKLTATRADLKSFVVSSEADPDVKVELLGFKWQVRRCLTNPALVRAFRTRMVEGAKVSLPFPRSRCKKHVIPSGVQSHRIVLDEKAFLPQLIYVAITDQDSAIGNFKKSQFNFKPHGVSSYDLLLDGVVLGRSLKCSYDSNNAVEAYVQTVSAIGQTSTRSGNGISYQDFLSNKNVVVFSMNEPKNKEWSEYFHIKRKGTLELIISFAAATTTALTVFISDLREDNLQLDLEGRVFTTEPAV